MYINKNIWSTIKSLLTFHFIHNQFIFFSLRESLFIFYRKGEKR